MREKSAAPPGPVSTPAGRRKVQSSPLASWFLRLRDLWGFAPAALFVLLFALLPLLALVADAIGERGGLAGLTAVLVGNGIFARLTRQGLSNSLWQGALSAGLAFSWGFPTGAFVGRRTFRGRELLLGFLLLPFLLPTLVVVLGVQELFAGGGAGAGAPGLLTSLWAPASQLGHGLPGIVTVNVFYNTSVVTLFTASGTSQASGSLEEAVATLGGGPWRAFRDVWGRPALLGASAGTLLTFLFSFLSFAPPLILGGGSNYTIEDWIYAFFELRPGVPLGISLTVSLWTMVLLLVPSVVYVLLARRVRLVATGPDRSTGALRPISLGGLRPLRWSWDLPFLVATVLLVGFVALLLGGVLGGSFLAFPGPGRSGTTFSTTAWSLLFSDRVTQALSGTSTVQVIGNTLFFAGVSTLLLLLVGLVAGYSRLRHPWSGLAVDVLSFVPLLSSPIILALALWSFYAGSLYTSSLLWVLIVGAQAGLALPFALQTMSTAFRANPPAPREAAETLGATRLRAFLDADVPLARYALVTASLFTFSLSLGEFAATNFLYTPPYTTLVVEMYFLTGGHLLGAASAAVAQAVGGLLVLVSLASFLVILGVGRRAGR